MQLIYERDVMGDYTLAWQDRFWFVFIFDLWSSDEYKYNRLYPVIMNRDVGWNGGWSYEMSCGPVPMWTRRNEAEAFAKMVREWLYEATKKRGVPTAEVYVMNLGDDRRHEATVIGPEAGSRPRTTPKFKGSAEAWRALDAMRDCWRREFSG